MVKWLKLYATYTFSTSPNLCHRTTLLNTDVQNCYITLKFITIYYTASLSPASIGWAFTDWLAECRSHSKESVFVDVLLSGTRTDVKMIVLWVGRAATVNSFSSVKNMNFNRVVHRSDTGSEAAELESILACLLAAVSSWVLLIFFRHLSCSSFFTIRWTLDRWMPESQSNCNKFQCYVTILNICQGSAVS